MHDCLACSLAKGFVKVGPVVLRQIVAHKRLAAVFVYPLKDLRSRQLPKQNDSAKFPDTLCTHLVARSIAQTREKRSKLASHRCRSVFLEDNLVQQRSGCDLERDSQTCEHSAKEPP